MLAKIEQCERRSRAVEPPEKLFQAKSRLRKRLQAALRKLEADEDTVKEEIQAKNDKLSKLQDKAQRLAGKLRETETAKNVLADKLVQSPQAEASVVSAAATMCGDKVTLLDQFMASMGVEGVEVDQDLRQGFLASFHDLLLLRKAKQLKVRDMAAMQETERAKEAAASTSGAGGGLSSTSGHRVSNTEKVLGRAAEAGLGIKSKIG